MEGTTPEPDEGIAADRERDPERRPSSDEPAESSADDSGSDAGGKDSGCEVAPDAEPPYTPPDADLAARIVAQVEFYFSDANITKDAFLLKHVRRNKEGYVSLKLISSFKRVKHLTKDWRVVAEALKKSTKLEINELGTKLRRIDPLPAYDETTPSRTVVAVRMPIERPTVENVSRLFAGCGEIALVRVLRPGNPVPADVRQFLNKNPSLVNCVCALVEFTESEAAREALRLQNNNDDEGMKVYELNGVPREPKRKTAIRRPPPPRRHDCEYSSCCSGSEAEYEYRYGPGFYRRNSSGMFAPRSPEIQTWVPRRLSTCSHSSDSGVSMYSHCGSRRTSSASTSSGEGWLARRLSGCSVGGDCSGRRLSCTPRFEPRTPVVPDGTRGFHAAARQRRISDLALYSR